MEILNEIFTIRQYLFTFDFLILKLFMKREWLDFFLPEITSWSNYIFINSSSIEILKFSSFVSVEYARWNWFEPDFSLLNNEII